MTMAMLLARIHLVVGVVAILMVVAMATPSTAQQLNPDGSPNSTASGVDERMLLREVRRIEGWIDIPDQRESVLIQPAGRAWDYFHEVILHWLGTIVILGMIVVLAIAYLVIRRLRISAGRSGMKVPRFNGFERFSHWLTAVSFVVLGLTGLNITFGKIVLLPLVGPDDFTAHAGRQVCAQFRRCFVRGWPDPDR
jgi:formate dehydrogenase subunit gamma